MSASASSFARGKRKATAAAMPKIAQMNLLLAADSDGDECIVLESEEDDAFVTSAAKKSKHVHHPAQKPAALANAQDGDDADDASNALGAASSASVPAPPPMMPVATALAMPMTSGDLQAGVTATTTAVTSFLAAADVLRAHAPFFSSLDASVKPLAAENFTGRSCR